MLLFNNQPGCVTPGHDPNSTAGLTIPVVSLPQDFGHLLLKQLLPGSSVSVTVSMMDLPAFDPSAIMLWALAVVTVVWGAYWSGLDHTAAGRGARHEEVGRAWILKPCMCVSMHAGIPKLDGPCAPAAWVHAIASLRAHVAMQSDTGGMLCSRQTHTCLHQHAMHPLPWQHCASRPCSKTRAAPLWAMQKCM